MASKSFYTASRARSVLATRYGSDGLHIHALYSSAGRTEGVHSSCLIMHGSTLRFYAGLAVQPTLSARPPSLDSVCEPQKQLAKKQHRTRAKPSSR